jgi:hypothetical protein
VAPAVALLNYVSSGIFGGFFPKLEFSRGFLYVCIIYISGRISAAVKAGDIIFFSLAGPVGYYTGNIIIQGVGGSVERYMPLVTRVRA